MRTTQFIGLTKNAKSFVAALHEILSARTTTGMFDEEIGLLSWIDEGMDAYDEIVQVVPWSSGPMIFTCLLCNGKRMFEWLEDESVKGEVDFEGGKYWA